MKARTTLRTAGLSVLAASAQAMGGAPGAAAASRPPIKDCGDVSTLDSAGFFLGAITAQGGSCVNARIIAKKVTKRTGCKAGSSCSEHGYTCIAGNIGSLTSVRCENSKQTVFIRWEYGS